jgi:alanine racemase
MEATGIVEIDLAALARNYRVLARAAAPGECGAVVKANAYGLGVAPVARALEAAGCRHFFVAKPAEGVELRALLPDTEIFVLEGLAGSRREALLAARLTPVLGSLAELEAWGRAGPAAVQIDTGMSRLGLSAADIDSLKSPGRDAAAAAGGSAGNAATQVDIRYVMTHFACAEEPAHALNDRQLAAFATLRKFWPDARTSLGNSAALLSGERYASDLARPGVALYGSNPFADRPSPVEPVVTVQGRILQLREIEAGTSVGYDATFVAKRRTRLAVVGVGYADGYLRSLSNRGIVVIAGQRVPVAGRVSMDLTCIDVTDIGQNAVVPGDWATLIGGDVPLDEVALLAGTNSYELLTRLGHRLERRYRHGNPGEEQR